MRLHRIKAKNFLSLHNCTITDLDAHLNFIVGPNGSGKTAIFRLLRVMRDVFAAASIGKRTDLSDLCTQGIVPQEIDLSITVEFNTLWEQELMLAFLCAALSQPNVLSTALTRLQNRNAHITSEEHLAFTQWLMQNIRIETITFFFRGDLRVTYRGGLYEYWRLSYTFMCKEEPVTIIMGYSGNANGTFCQGEPPEVVTSGLSGGDCLLTFLWEASTHKKPEEGGPLAEFFTQQPASEPPSLNTEKFFLFLANQKGSLQVEPIDPQYTVFSFYSILREASDINFSQGAIGYLPFSTIFSILLNRAFVFTNNVRLPFSMPIALDINAVLSQEISLDNEQQIPKWLFRLKNGDDAEQARFQRIRKSFSMLVSNNQSFDLTLKHIPTDSMQEKLPELDIRVKNASTNSSLAYQGAGIWEALVLSTLLDESEGRLILFDEPAANLHQGMQHRLGEILSTTPGQVIVVTHSAHLLPILASEFRRVYRAQKVGLDTQIFSLGQTFATEQEKLENELRSSSEIAGLLFANGVLLVEGPTEIGAFNEWFPQSIASQGKTFSDHNITLHALNGKAEIPFYLRFLTAFGVPWAVICDGDALQPPNKSPNDKLWKVLKELRLIPTLPSGTASFEELRAQAANAGVYTYNISSATEFETLPEVKQFLDVEYAPSRKTAYRGRYIALHLSCPLAVAEVLQQAMERLITR